MYLRGYINFGLKRMDLHDFKLYYSFESTFSLVSCFSFFSLLQSAFWLYHVAQLVRTLVRPESLISKSPGSWLALLNKNKSTATTENQKDVMCIF